MSEGIFISYSSQDKEFVTRLASDLNAKLTGVWLDKSKIQLGQNWHDEIMDGIRECKAFVLVLSPDAMKSRYVREELKRAQELRRTIFPVIYRKARWTGEFAALVKDIETLDLRKGSYVDNFQRLVDGLIEARVGRATDERPFLRPPTRTSMKVVLGKIPGWAFAWSVGWVVFWVVAIILFTLAFSSSGDQSEAGTTSALAETISTATTSTTNGAENHELITFLSIILMAAGTAGFAGGLLAGLFTMLALKAQAPSISWKHMAPTIRIWGISGPLGIIVAGLITAAMTAAGAIRVQPSEVNCDGKGFGECIMAEIMGGIGDALEWLFLVALAFLLLVLMTWFLTGVFAGRLAVRHIRRLEPGITNRQSWKVSTGWGCGAVLAAISMCLLIQLFVFK